MTMFEYIDVRIHVYDGTGEHLSTRNDRSKARCIEGGKIANHFSRDTYDYAWLLPDVRSVLSM